MSQIEICFRRPLRGEIILPASKSISNRALVIRALAAMGAEGTTPPLSNISTCDDSRVVVGAMEQLAKSQTGNTIDIGAAGTAMRFLTAMLSVVDGENVITGTERMRHRPIGILVDALRLLGAEVEYIGEEGFPPLRIKGHTLEGGELTLPGDVSSQYISALLMISPRLKCGLRLHLRGKVVSRPYIEMTLAMMRQFGAKAEMPASDMVVVEPEPYRLIPYYIENDWSAASYWYEMVAIQQSSQTFPDGNEAILQDEITLPGLFRDSLQGDSRVAELFKPLGVETVYMEKADGIETVVLRRKVVEDTQEAYNLDLANQPDLAQTLVATCCALDRKFCFTGLDNLRIKETDRLVAMQTEMMKLGYAIEIVGDGTLRWNGQKYEPTGESLDTYEDHRMAMSLAPMAMRCGRLIMNNPEVVSKSYPGFWRDIDEHC